VIAFKLWTTMSKAGELYEVTLTPDEREVAQEMVRRGLVESCEGVLRQSPAATIDRWEGLA
jgi:hypothetical protein